MTVVPRSRIVHPVAVAVLCGIGFWLWPIAVAHASFGIEVFENQIVEAGNTAATQAGSHPYAMTTEIVINHHPGNPRQVEGGVDTIPDGEVQNVEVNLPVGVIANPTATSVRCKEAELELTGKCPQASVIGVDTFRFGILNFSESVPVYNMETTPDEPAEFGFKALFEGITVHIIGKVRSGSDYGLTGEVPDVSQQVAFWGNTLTLYGMPPGAEKPFLTLPTSCGGPLTSTVTANTWQEPDFYLPPVAATSHDSEGDPMVVSGCEKLRFDPRLAVQPTSHLADSPTGLSVEMTVPQEESATGLAEADLKEAVVTLPQGMAISPAAANGQLSACSPSEIALDSPVSPSCPESSKVGSVEIVSPLLETPLLGSVYLAQQENNPFHSLIALYLVAEGKGVVIKVPGEGRLDPVTGQLTTRFGEDPVTKAFLPQLPFSHLRLNFFGGPRAPLVTPSTCGTYTVTSSLTPWSAPQSGPPATPASTFDINEGCAGGQFHPSFTAGTINNQAGGFSPFTFTGFRNDGEQSPSRIQVQTPPGLLGMVSEVPLCGEPQAESGGCGQASEIGHVTVGVGAGPDPLYVKGDVFLTGAYHGAPYGLSVVVPAVAGPFNLGTVVVRAEIDVDPRTAALTVTSEPLPQIRDGIPLQVRVVSLTVDRNHFIFNPTNCSKLSIGTTLTSALGANAVLSSPFEAANCDRLSFDPKFSFTTSGRVSRVNGTSLDTRVSYPAGSLGAAANIAKVKVELPKRLPARLTTLQKACLAAVFNTNPAQCPAASVVGIVKAATPVLPIRLSGPVYFVSHGAEKFPDLEVVLQGDGVRVDLVGETFISKAGITTSTFDDIPDVPVESFELYLPSGPASALTASGDPCRGGLEIPTTIVGQNGAQIHRKVPIAVSGCSKGNPKKRATAARRPRAIRHHHRGGSVR